MEYVLKTNALSKEYGKFKVLNELTMNVPKGAIYGFIGKNGAGKTTLIRLICGLAKPSSGTYTLYGRKSTHKMAAISRRKIGAVVETPSIYLDMTAEENLKQQYRILGERTFVGLDEILKLVGLEHTGKRKAKNFSLGMRQRLGIAIALAGNPDFLVLDEPVNGLDPQGIMEMRELILKINRDKYITVLISSHILGELSKIATHYGFIDKGHMIKEMSAAELQAASRKCMHITVNDTKLLKKVLDKGKIEYKILSATQADIFAKVKVSTLVQALDKVNCEVVSIYEQDESLENYYINLIGGGSNV